MEWFEPLIVIAAVAFVGLVIFLHFYLKKKGKSLSAECNGHCSSCHACSSCKKMHEEYRKMYPKDENVL